MHNDVETVLSNITVDGKSVPFAHIKFTKQASLYITYQFINERPELCADDLPETSVVEVDIDIYSRSRNSLIAAQSEILTAFIGAGWTWVELSPEMYEEDTKLIHRTVTFEKERMI